MVADQKYSLILRLDSAPDSRMAQALRELTDSKPRRSFQHHELLAFAAQHLIEPDLKTQMLLAFRLHDPAGTGKIGR